MGNGLVRSRPTVGLGIFLGFRNTSASANTPSIRAPPCSRRISLDNRRRGV
jgi:hypothetical protein